MLYEQTQHQLPICIHNCQWNASLHVYPDGMNPARISTALKNWRWKFKPLTGPSFLLETTVKSGQKSRSHRALRSDWANGKESSCLVSLVETSSLNCCLGQLGRLDQKKLRQSGSSNIYGSKRVRILTQLITV